MNRFDYVAYDEQANALAGEFKGAFVDLEAKIESHFASPKSAGVARYKAMLLSKLEEAYMFVGKAIRDDQIARNGSAELQEGRTNS